jgi:hypothetical protein
MGTIKIAKASVVAWIHYFTPYSLWDVFAQNRICRLKFALFASARLLGGKSGKIVGTK